MHINITPYILNNCPPDISQNLLKNALSLSSTVSRFMVRSPVGEKRETGGNTLAIAVPVDCK